MGPGWVSKNLAQRVGQWLLLSSVRWPLDFVVGSSPGLT